jgi:hypothetical protein
MTWKTLEETVRRGQNRSIKALLNDDNEQFMENLCKMQFTN